MKSESELIPVLCTPEEFKLHKALREERANKEELGKMALDYIKKYKKSLSQLLCAQIMSVIAVSALIYISKHDELRGREINYQKEIQKQLIINLTTKTKEV